jgi:farnesyl-diphosphate farnesyltransferase
MADFDYLLSRTSRTFGLAIPLLAAPLRHEVTLAYLLLRIADTLEDAACWEPPRRAAALRALEALLVWPRDAEARRLASDWQRPVPCHDPACRELLQHMPAVVAAARRLETPVRQIILDHARRTAGGMAQFVRQCDAAGRLRLQTLDELRRYCYAVAGIVGEMLTALFVCRAPQLLPAQEALRREAPLFGEALQLVNIVKDAADDARDGRVYLPPGWPRQRIFELARDDLRRAACYTEVLRAHGAPADYVAFTAFPAQLADLALDAVERHGPGAKVPKQQVAALLQQLGATLPATWRDDLPPGR